MFMFFFSSKRRHTRCSRDWSSDVCSSDLYMHIRGHGDPVSLAQTLHAALALSKTPLSQPAPTPPAALDLDTAALEKTLGSKDRKSTRLNSSHGYISYAVFCLKKKKHTHRGTRSLSVS